MSDREVVDTPGPPGEAEIRAAAGRVARTLFLLFGVGIGIAASLAVVDRPPEVHEEVVSVDPGSDTFVAGPAEQGEEGSEGQVVRRRVAGTAGSAGSGPGASGSGGGGTGSAGPGGDTQSVANPKDYKCEAGKNGGSTDVGVTGNSIKVAANVVQDGPGASFLKEAVIGIEAVFDEVNVRGICGRKIVLTKRNDSWEASTGLQYIENYIQQDHFALAVNPSSEGLHAAVENGTIDRAGIPVVGTDGMLISQYRWPENAKEPGMSKWLWPVAASTVSTMHIMTEHAFDLAGSNAKKVRYGLVYDQRYKFGVEGAEAFENHLKRLGVPSDNIKTLGILPAQDTYTEPVATFNSAGMCGNDSDPKCHLVGMLLDPSTAITWIKSGGTFGAEITAGPQTLFNRAFAVNCVEERKKLPGAPGCDLIVWTGYNPPVGTLANLPDVAKYVSDVKSRNAQADVENSFTQGAYLGARVFVEALEQVGPNLTRDNLRAVLDSMTFQSDLSNDLTWTSKNHFANTAMQAFRVGYTPNGFTGWQNENTGWVEDSAVGKI